MKYFLIAGEASGDLHGANLMKELKNVDTDAEFVFWGGDKMNAQGGKMLKHYAELAFMGFAEVLLNIRTINKNFELCRNQLSEHKPDVIILIDYPGFNLRMAKYAKETLKLKVFYYISPKIWAWKKNRAYKIKKYVDKMFVIFPFETNFYEKYDYQVEYVGNPVLDALPDTEIFDKQAFIQKNNLSENPIIALLPGSRKQEIKSMMPVMLKTAQQYPNYQFVVAGAPSLSNKFYQEHIGQLSVVYDQTYHLLQASDAALVTSGTATLETALLHVPQVVLYTTSPITYQIAKNLIRIRFISLVNIIMDTEVVTELIQHRMTLKNITQTLDNLLNKQSNEHKKMMTDYQQLYQKLGGKGASERSAKLMVEFLKN